MSGDLENLILSTIERYMASRYSERHGLVTSYDPERYLAKVTFQPEGQESGWLPIETGHIGNGFGIAVGLQPGDGKQSGDQVIVRYQEGDFESGKIVQRVHSDNDRPPTVQSGEMVFWTRFQKTAAQQSGLSDDTTDPTSGSEQDASSGQQGSGQQIFFKNDGSITWTDGNGATIVFDGQGNCTLTCKNLTHNVSGDHTVNISGKRSMTINKTDTVKIDQSKSVNIGQGRTDQVGGSWSTQAQAGVWPWLTDLGDMAD
jgi:uncharacterized protein involved in type VI secretion and phage assembly